MLDLHTHSTFSDGSDRPEALVRQAVGLGLRALALTDHDNVRGVPSFLAACRAEGIAGLAGVELSVEVSSGTLHMLGLGIDPDHDELNAKLSLVLEGRDGRNRRILRKLNALGCGLEWAEIAALAGEEVVGRPHFAQAMVQRGLVHDRQEAFDCFLARGQAAYVDRFRLTPAEAIRLIRDAGGVSVLAHPFTWHKEVASLAPALKELKSQGLGGLEVYYPEHTAEMTRDYLALTRQMGLVASGGSDYHGPGRPENRLGIGDGRLSVPDNLLPPLLAAMGPQACLHLV